MTEQTTTIKNKNGVHALPASLFVGTASQFSSKIQIAANNKKVDAKSILMLMALCLKYGTEVKISAEGEDEETAVKTLIDLIDSKFGEESLETEEDEDEDFEEYEIDFISTVEEYFDNNGCSYELKEVPNSENMLFFIPITSKHLPNLEIMFLVSPEGFCRIFTFLANKISDTKRAKMLEIINELNVKYSYVKLTLDNENSVTVEYDFDLCNDEEIAMAQVQSNFDMAVDVIEECIPPIMKLIWAD